MKAYYSLVIVIAVCLGCESSRPKAEPQLYPDFESAMEAIATSSDIWEAGAAAKQIYSGGLPAIETLRVYLDDDRVIPSGLCSRSINSGEIRVGQQASWTIQEMIEVGLSKAYGPAYHVLTDDNLEQWLDDRKGMSLTELRIEAATAQLHQAKQQVKANAPHAKEAVHTIEDQLAELKRIVPD